MIGNGLIGVGVRPWAALGFGALACIFTQVAQAADCPGHPDALGTSRTLVVDPREHPRIGSIQYPETLPLEDHEVVLSFDDGPLPRNSNQILDILAEQCVKATFFEVGVMARAYPENVRKLRDAGHSIGTHSQHHPVKMDRMPIERAKAELDDGIASVKWALGDETSLAPFFRIPGLARADALEEYAASEGIQIWSADFPADDWHRISPARVYELAIKRLEEHGRGILLLHDIQPRTVAALPGILREIKARGFRIVHVVPATLQNPATPTESQQWHLHPSSETVAIAHWPKIPNFVFADAEMLPAPALSDADWQDGVLMPPFAGAGRRARDAALRETSWPQPTPIALDSAEIALPTPAQAVFEIQEDPRGLALSLGPFSHRPSQAAASEREPSGRGKLASVDAGNSPRPVVGNYRYGRNRRFGVSHVATRGSRFAAHAVRSVARHAGPARRVARGGSVRHNL
jgi:peptidoglycan/xylan/chitin deacetylase (PgdA/CDA1 family)